MFYSPVFFVLCMCVRWCMDAPCRGIRTSPVCRELSDDGTTHLLSASVKIPSFPSFASMSFPPSVPFLHLVTFLLSLTLHRASQAKVPV